MFIYRILSQKNEHRQAFHGEPPGASIYFFLSTVKLIIMAHFFTLGRQKNRAKKTRTKRVMYFVASRPGAIKTACPEKQVRRLSGGLPPFAFASQTAPGRFAPLQSRMYERQTVLFYQHGASPTVYFYGILAKS
jgi:hypothetical protein